jgi:hypothetical protein
MPPRRAPCGAHVGPDVADDHAPLDGHAAGARRGEHHARCWLAERTPVVGPVRAPQHRIERAEQLDHPVVHGLDLRGGQQPASHAALVRHDGQAEVGGAQAAEPGGDAR